MKQKKHRYVSAFLTFALLVSLGLTAISTASAADWGVDNALAPTGDWNQLDTAEEQWYAFHYAGDGSQIQVRLEATPEGSAGFVVWTPEEIQSWAIGKRVTPIGRGSDDPFSAGELVWSGSFTTAGTYYVVVEHSGNPAGTSYYRLTVEGDGVSLADSARADTPASAPTTTSKSTGSQPLPTLPSELSGRLVFQTTYGGPFYTIDADGSDLQRITNGIDPVWSPDGEQIAFVRWEEPRGVWVVDADGSNAHRVFDWSQTRYPSWSPDGQEIVFSRQKSGGGGGGFPGGFPGMSGDVAASAGRPPGGPPGGGPSGSGGTLGIVDASDGTFREPLPASDTNLTPDWSPTGEQIVFAGNNGLMVQSVDGVPSTDGAGSWQLTTNPYDTTPVWSPDGTKVAFVRRQHDHWEIYVIDTTTGRQTRLTDTPEVNGVAANSLSPAWSPDGSHIAFFTDRTGEWEIWAMSANGSHQRPLFDTELDGLTLEYAYAGERAISWTE
jgi:hypothetical protein